MDHCTRKLLSITDKNLFFKEEWLEIVDVLILHTCLKTYSPQIYKQTLNTLIYFL